MKTCCFFIGFVIAITHVYVAFGCSSENKGIDRKADSTICTTNECINAASQISAKLNRTVDPCDNFYKFACGGWIQKNPVNECFPYIDTFVNINRKTENQLRETCKAIRENNTEIWNQYIKWLWSATRRTWEEELFQDFRSWQDFNNNMLEKGFDNGLFDIDVFSNFDAKKRHIIIRISPTFLPPSKMNQSETLSSLIEMNILSSYRNNLDNITRIASEIETFANELNDLKISHDYDKNRRVWHTIQDLQKDYDEQHPEQNGKIDWQVTIQKVFASEGIIIETSETIINNAYSYLRRVASLLERTSSRTIINYMKWNWFNKFSPYVQRSNTSDIRWKTCLSTINFKSVLSHEYVKKYAPLDSLHTLREMNYDIEDVINEQISRATWMDEPTKEASLVKLSYVRTMYITSLWHSDEEIDRYYESLNVTMDYFENMVNILIFERKKVLRSLRTPVDELQSLVEPTEVSAHYAYRLNTVGFSAALLQPPIYYVMNISTFPSINYGSLGFFIGHEISHGFDLKGRNFDEHGNKVYWWTQRSTAAFYNVTQCFLDQYNTYLFPGVEHNNTHINEQLTLSENVVDSAGIVSAYHAYKKKAARLNKTEWYIRGLDEYSSDQIFFMTYAQMMCANHHPAMVSHMLSDVHAPNELRVRGSLSNSREFSEAYNCTVGTPMNPEKKCSLWY